MTRTTSLVKETGKAMADLITLRAYGYCERTYAATAQAELTPRTSILAQQPAEQLPYMLAAITKHRDGILQERGIAKDANGNWHDSDGRNR